MKDIKINKGIKLFVVFIISLNFGYSQVSNYEKIEKTGCHSFNYLNKDEVKTKKDKDIFVVYSDREDNQAYFDPYQQKKAKKQKLLTPYFVIDKKNNAYELVIADSSQIGKPKGIFSFLMSKKNHFKDAKGVEYIGWIPKENLLTYNQSYISTSNNKPLKYKVGNHSLKKLSEISKFIKEDSVLLFKDPLLKEVSPKKLAVNQTVYPYKYSRTGEAVLISNSPTIKDTITQITGWVPSSMINSVGQGKTYKMENSTGMVITQEECDTIKLSNQEIYSDYLYDLDAFRPEAKKDTANIINIPFYVWDHHHNKLINVKGNDILISEVDRFEEENKTINFHFIFNINDRNSIKPLINSLQNIWIYLSNNKNLKYSFSSICMGNGYSYILPKTNSFEDWLDFIQKIADRDNSLKKYRDLDLTQAISSSLSDATFLNKNFQTNFFIISGSNNLYNLNQQDKILRDMTLKSSIALFIQLDNKLDESYQNYLLYAKEVLAKLSYYRNSFIKNYIVDSDLVINNNTFKNIPAENSNLYIYDAPKNSLYNGGIVFPSINQSIEPASVSIAIDSILLNQSLIDKRLISSLKEYKSKLGVIWSKPSAPVKCFFKTDSLKVNIEKENLNEVLYRTALLNDSFVKPFQKGYELTKDKLIELIKNYRALLPNFTELNKDSRKILKNFTKGRLKKLIEDLKEK